MATKTPQKQAKSRRKSIRNRAKVGDVSYYEMCKNGKWGSWLVDCRSKLIPKSHQRRTYHSRPDAQTAALELNDRLQTYKLGRKHPLDTLGDQIHDHVRARQRLIDFKSKTKTEFLPTDVDELDIMQSVEISLRFMDAVIAVNRVRKANDKPLWNTSKGIEDWQYEQTKRARRKDVLYVQRINQFLKFKTGPVGSKRGRVELAKDSKAEWVGRMKLLKDWIGNRLVRERKESKDTIEYLLKRIDEAADPRTGKLWSPLTKFKAASKFKEFGAWMEQEDYVKTNPLEALPRNYNTDNRKGIVVYTNEQVEQILAKAITGKRLHQIIPYLAMTLFSTCRPSDIAYEKSNRVMKWNQIFFGKAWPKVEGSAQIYLPQYAKDGKRKSKTRDRYGLLYPNGIEWLDWYYQTFHEGKFPTVFYSSRRKFTRLSKLCDFDWTPDAPRHTSISCALGHYVFDGVEDFMARRYGNSVAVIKSNYESPAAPEIAEAFFNITPKSVMEKFKITKSMLKELVNG